MLNVYEQVDANKRRSAIIIILFVVFIAAAVYVFSKVFGFGLAGTGIALILAGLISFFGYWFSDKIITTISGARPANRQQDFLFYTAVENLCIVAQIPKPKLYVIEDTAPNAFAAGRDPEHSIVCATTGLLQKLNRTQLEGVVGHELSHIKNFDTRLMSIVTILVGTITLLADWFLRATYFGGRREREDRESGQLQVILFVVGIILALLSPLIAQLIQLAISRRREFLADASSALLTRQPEGLVQALEIISQDKEPLEAANKATAHLYITNPLKNVHQGVGLFASLFNTHPPVQERIKALKSMT
jgi:heat shock protein HtpX